MLMDLYMQLTTWNTFDQLVFLVCLNVFVPMVLQVLVSLIPVEMGEHALHRTQPTIHVVVLLASLVQTAVQISNSVHLAPVSMVEHALRGMGQQLAVFVLEDLLAQDVTLIFHSVRLKPVLMEVHASKDLEP